MERASHPSDPDADLHRGQPIESAGAPPRAADAAVIMLHGRGSSARWFLRLIDEFLHHGVMYLAPQAAGRSWYPRPGDAPLDANEPWLSSAFARVGDAIRVATDADVPVDRVLLLGFSQGAGVVSEYVVRTPRRYGGLVALSGSLLGPEISRADEGSIDGTPVFFGCSSDDPHVPPERVRDSASVFEGLGGEVTCRLYDDLGHAINDDEIHTIDAFVGRLLGE
jgi:phospholipase/carboxylesterase